MPELPPYPPANGKGEPGEEQELPGKRSSHRRSIGGTTARRNLLLFARNSKIVTPNPGCGLLSLFEAVKGLEAADPDSSR
jgi:hypothetical protein